MLADRVLYPVVISSSGPQDPTPQFMTPEKPASSFWHTSHPPSGGGVIPVGVIQGHATVIVDAEDKWQENLHVLLDDYAFLVVSAEPEHSCGVIRLVAPIHQVIKYHLFSLICNPTLTILNRLTCQYLPRSEIF